MKKRYRVLTADPPWPFKDKLPGKGRGAAKHYQKDLTRNPQHETARTELERLVREHARRER